MSRPIPSRGVVETRSRSCSRPLPARARRLVALLLLLAGALPAQGDLLCARCKTTGRVASAIDGKFAIEDAGEFPVVHCSELIEEHPTHGLDWEPCPRCKAPSLQAKAQQEHDALVAGLLQWLAARRQIDEATRTPGLVHLETEHFLIAWDLDSIKTDDRKVYRQHEAAHLYAQRMEGLYARFQQLFGITDDNNIVDKHHLYVFEKEAAYRIAGPLYTGLSGGSTVKRSGGDATESSIVTWWDKTETPSEPDVHRNLVHNVIHLLTSAYYDWSWFPPGEVGLMPLWLNDKYGWLDAGLAHWFEWELDEKCTTYCFREQDATSRWKGLDWKKNVWKAVTTGSEEIPSFADAVTKPTQALSALEHQFCWSWVDFLISRGSERMGVLLRLCKQERPVRDMLKEAYEISFLTFEQEWAAWVATEYAPERP